jgi:hypothetical protein
VFVNSFIFLNNLFVPKIFAFVLKIFAFAPKIFAVVPKIYAFIPKIFAFNPKISAVVPKISEKHCICFAKSGRLRAKIEKCKPIFLLLLSYLFQKNLFSQQRNNILQNGY